MIKEAVFHLNTEDFIYPIARNRLVIRIRAARDDVRSCAVRYWSRTTPEDKKEQPLEAVQADELYAYYEATLEFPKVARYQKYYFILTDRENKSWYYSPQGISEKLPEEDFFEFLYANEKDVVAYPEWAKGIIYYQIFPERFFNGDTSNDPAEVEPWGAAPTRENFMGGDLKGIKEKIPYLQELGIEAIYLNPIFQADFNHKYATTDYFRVDPAFGSNEEFKELVAALHEAGIRILLDGVFNHTGIHFEMFQDVLKEGKDSEFYDWFLPSTESDIQITHHDYECVGAYKYMPKLNSSNSRVREFILRVMDFWIKNFQIDGWRLDVADEVDVTVWQEVGTALKEKYPEIILLGETWGYGGKLVAGKRLDAVMNYMFRDAVREYFGYEKDTVVQFDHRLNRMLALYKKETNEVMYNLIDSHDTERFLYYCDNRREKLKLAASFQILFPGAPAIYYGDEVGMTGGNDPECRGCMLWGEKQDKELFEWYRRLIKIRKEHPAVRKGTFRTIKADETRDIYIFERADAKEQIIVLLRKGNKEKVSVSKSEIPGAGMSGTELISGDIIECESSGMLEMEPYSVKVIAYKL